VADLTPDEFADFFEAVHSTDQERRQLFDWQRRLAGEILGTNGWPEVIRIPTGCGKTTVLDLAVFELALQASRKTDERTAARRICFVIDRRLVVDEVTEHARRIHAALGRASANPNVPRVVKAVSERLRDLGPGGGEPLRLVRLRGGVYRDDGWAADPLTPTILVSTVDQIGSRLLFRGYGVSRRNLAVHAGLFAFDSRIIIDEAHLSTVFGETLGCVRRFQRLAETSPLPERRILSVVCMSATAGEGGRPFDLLPDERKDERLRPRLEASKPAELISIKVEPITKQLRQDQPAKARELEKRNRRSLIEEVVRTIRHHAGIDAGDAAPDLPRVIGVVVNRVATARQVFMQLQRTGDGADKHNTLLLTGRIRPFDRDRLLEQWLPRIRAGRKQEPEAALFVVATQTIEVGANIDFDALITEAAPLDALRQRFGRLDRLGKRHERGAPSRASIFIRNDQAKNSDDDLVYGSAIAETWKGLQGRIAFTTGKGAAKRAVVDFGINSLDEKLPKASHVIRPMLAPPVQSPFLFPAHLDAWVQTNPQPEPDPDVAPFLHGRADTPADVQVVWRADLDPDHRSLWPAIVSLMPPLSREALPVPVYEVHAWLKHNDEQDVADVEGTRAETSDLSAERDQRYVARWRGKDDLKVVGPDGVKPGDTIVVPAKYGGADSFGWSPNCTDPVADVADQCLAQLIASYPDDAFRRPKLRLRLHPTLLSPADSATRMRLNALLRAAVTAASSEEQDAWPAAGRLLEALEPLCADAHIKAAIGAVLKHRGRVDRYPGDGGVVITASVPLAVPPPLPAEEMEYDELEGDQASFTGRQTLLGEHVEGVTRTVRNFAIGCGLDSRVVKTLEQAGVWHDEGKRDRRFQAWLRGSELQALAANEPIAKSGRDVSEWKSSTLFGYPRGARHEFVSVRLFEQAYKDGADEFLIDLAKFLIGVHHGFGRPFPPVVKDCSPVEVSVVVAQRELKVSSDHRLHRLGSGWTDLFWCMVRRFGWWGLAYLEALFITADRTVSARERQRRETASEAIA
jgi:CRISPR-associated endonuclease/helicase Cas3